MHRHNVGFDFLGLEKQYIMECKTEAIKLYQITAKQGNVNAQYNLGWCYEYGEGIGKDIFEAIKWYKKAAELGNDSAYKLLLESNQ